MLKGTWCNAQQQYNVPFSKAPHPHGVRCGRAVHHTGVPEPVETRPAAVVEDAEDVFAVSDDATGHAQVSAHLDGGQTVPKRPAVAVSAMFTKSVRCSARSGFQILNN